MTEHPALKTTNDRNATVYGYVRVSTDEQAEGSSLEDQAQRVLGVAMARGQTLARVFSDPGISGTEPVFMRPAGAELSKLLKPGDVIIVAKMDRMFRMAQDALITAQDLANRGVALVIGDMGTAPINNGNAASAMFFQIMASVAQFERSRILERVTAGRKAKAQQGGHVGGEAPYGYRIVGRGRAAMLEPEPAEQAVIARVKELRGLGKSMRAVAQALSDEGLGTRNGTPFTFQAVALLARKTE